MPVGPSLRHQFIVALAQIVAFSTLAALVFALRNHSLTWLALWIALGAFVASALTLGVPMLRRFRRLERLRAVSRADVVFTIGILDRKQVARLQDIGIMEPFPGEVTAETFFLSPPAVTANSVGITVWAADGSRGLLAIPWAMVSAVSESGSLFRDDAVAVTIADGAAGTEFDLPSANGRLMALRNQSDCRVIAGALQALRTGQGSARII